MSDEKKHKRPRGTGTIYGVPGSNNLWVGYVGPDGKYIRESSGSAKKTEAQNFLKHRLEAVSAGNFLGPRVEKITVNELFDDLLQDYKTHGKFHLWPERLGMLISRITSAERSFRSKKTPSTTA